VITSIDERVYDSVCEILGVNRDELTHETSFQENIGADSLDMVELMMKLEEEFELTIPEEQAEKLKTVGEVIGYIMAELDKK
jgi:acyl carrier protein